MRYDLPTVAATEPAETAKSLKLTVTAKCYICIKQYKECKQYYGSRPPVLENINSPVLWTSG
jgi:hypothetical protein